MQKLFILSYIGSIHTKRWISSLAKHGYEIFLFGLNCDDASYYHQLKNVTVENFNIPVSSNRYLDWIYGKIGFMKASRIIRQRIRTFKPDILHAHYATSYGLLGANARFHPFILSVWGSDVYQAPHLSSLHKYILKRNLQKADLILSTSRVMADETALYTDKAIEITPFGVDMTLFKKQDDEPQRDIFIIGNVKSLKPVYGIDTLIKSFKLLKERNPEQKLQLEIIGEGPERKHLEMLAKKLDVDRDVIFRGEIDNEKLPEYYNRFNVAVFLSQRESFGVSAIEAMACECAVVTSDAPGFQEVVIHEETGWIVPKENPEATANAIQQCISRPELREKIGKAGRARVKSLFCWEDNVHTMMNIYNRFKT